jgi:hypothetical protein
VGEIYLPSPLYRGNLGFSLSSPPHGRASARPQARADTLPRPRGPVAARRVSTRVRADARSQARAGVDPRPRGRDFYRADAVFTASTCKTASAGKRGRPDDVCGRPDGHFHPKSSFMTSLGGWAGVQTTLVQTTSKIKFKWNCLKIGLHKGHAARATPVSLRSKSHLYRPNRVKRIIFKWSCPKAWLHKGHASRVTPMSLVSKKHLFSPNCVKKKNI